MDASAPMTFRQHGRCYHLEIRGASDLRRVLDLDKAHWVATGAPVESLSFDPTFLSLVDSDTNGRILTFEVRESVSWLLDVLRDYRAVDAAEDALRIDDLNAHSGDGQRIQKTALKILAQAGGAGDMPVTLSAVREVKAHIEANPVSEAGVALPEAARDDRVRALMTDIVAVQGGVPHPAGRPGINLEQLDAFREGAAAYLAWHARGADVMPLGTDTPAAFQVYADLRVKIEQYFAQCEAVAFDARAADHVGPTEEQIGAADLQDPAAIAAFMQSAPLAPPDPGGTLRLDGAVNPFYAERLRALREKVVAPVLGSAVTALARRDWLRIAERMAPHAEWLAEQPQGGFDRLDPSTLRSYLAPETADAVKAIIRESTKTALDLGNIRLVEKLILYQANLLRLANNFVSFPDLYDPDQRAAFEMGTLVMDGRHLTFSVRAADPAAHAEVAKTSNIFLLYVEILPPGGAQAFRVAVPVTSGGKGNLCVGKRGVFIDVEGRESDARVIRIIENPISVTEAVISPFQRIGRLVSGKIESIATAAEKELDATAKSALDKGVAPAPQGTPNRGLLAGGLLMGGGVALAALSSAVAYIARTVQDVSPYKIAGVLTLAALAVIAPAAVLALLKLRRRDLSAVLEGAGWAINARMRLTLKQGRVFTMAPPLPEGAKGVCRWKLAVALAVVIAVEFLFLRWFLS